MANSKSNSGVAMDGLSIPASLYTKKRSPIPQNGLSVNETISPIPSKPAQNSKNSKK